MRPVIIAACLILVATAQEKRSCFATAYNEWLRIASATPEGTVGLPEMAAWNRTKDEWRKLERRVDAFYRGEAK